MKQDQKLLRWMQIQTIIMAVILVLLLAAGIFLVSQVAELGNLLWLMEEKLQALDLEAINEAVESLSAAGQEMANIDVKALNAAVAALKDAAGNLSAVDMEALNGAIDSLSGAAEGMMEMDFKALNELVETLDAVATRLEKVTKIFG